MFGLFTPSTRNTAAATTASTERRLRTVAPRCDIHETADAVIVRADMPGVGQDGVEVRIHGDTLTLNGRNAAAEPDRLVALWREYLPCDYERTFRLGQDIDPDQVNASMKDGVLRLELKKRPTATPRRIAVNAG